MAGPAETRAVAGLTRATILRIVGRKPEACATGPV